MKIHLDIEINAPRDRVFGVFSDIPKADAMLDAIEELEMLSDGPVGVGTRWRETRTLFGKQATEDMWVTVFDPPNTYEVDAESHGTHYRSIYRFTDAPGEQTAVSLLFEGKAVSLLAKLMMPLGVLFKPSTEKAFRADLEQLKSVCETPET